MKVICNSCQSRFNLPDDRVPTDQAVTLKCPKCKELITIAPAAATPEEMLSPGYDTASLSADFGFDEADGNGGYDAGERPFDFVEEGTLTSLVCIEDPQLRDSVVKTLESLDYRCTSPGNGRDALKRMRFHEFDLIIIDERFDAHDPDQNNLLRYMERLPMQVRRGTYVIMLTERFRSGDNMVAFNKSVNQVLNLSHTEHLEKVIQRGISEFEGFYKVFKESMLKTGRS